MNISGQLIDWRTTMARRYNIGDNVFIPKLNDSGKIIEIKKVYVTVLTYYKYVVKTQNNGNLVVYEYEIRMV